MKKPFLRALFVITSPIWITLLLLFMIGWVVLTMLIWPFYWIITGKPGFPERFGPDL